MYSIDSKQQILTEITFFRHLKKVAVCSGDEPRFNSKLYDRPLDRHFLGIDDIHVIDMQEELSKADGNMPLVDFLASMELRVAEMIVGRKPKNREPTANS